MIPSGTPTAGSRPFLVLRGPVCEWAIAAERVGEVLAQRPAGLGEPPDIEALLGLRSAGLAESSRVLALRTSQGACWLRCAGDLSIRDLSFSDVCELPGEVRRGIAGRVLSGVVFGEGSPPVLVVDVEELGRVAAERSSAASKR